MKYSRLRMITLLIIMSVVAVLPVSAMALGNNSGIDPANAREVTNGAELIAALADTGCKFIDMTGFSNFTIPAGIEVTIRPDVMIDSSGHTIVVEPGATLRNYGSWIDNMNIEVRGRVEQSKIGPADDVHYRIYDGGTLNVTTGSAINGDVTILGGTFTIDSGASIYGGTEIKLIKGTIVNNSLDTSFRIFQYGPESDCIVNGIQDSQLFTVSLYKDTVFSPISVPYTGSAFIGPEEGAILTVEPETGAPVYAKGYRIDLADNQTITVKADTGFNANFYLLKSITGNKSNDIESFYTSVDSLDTDFPSAGNTADCCYILVTGSSMASVGDFNIRIYDNSIAMITEPLDFTLAENDPGYPGTSGAGWTWNASEKTMTLDGIFMDVEYEFAIKLPDGSKVLSAAGSQNSISNFGTDYYSAEGIYCEGGLEVTGSGTLLINTASGVGIDAINGLHIHDCGTIQIMSRYGILNGDVEPANPLTIENCGSVLLNCKDTGIWSVSDINIINCPDIDVTASGENTETGYGICTDAGDINILNSNISVFGYSFGIITSDLFGTYRGGDIIITGSTVDASCADMQEGTSNTNHIAIFAGDDGVVHSRIILNGCSIVTPASGRVADVNIQYHDCQSVSTENVITNPAHFAKHVLIRPAAPQQETPEDELPKPPNTGDAGSALGFVLLAAGTAAALIPEKIRSKAAKK